MLFTKHTKPAILNILAAAFVLTLLAFATTSSAHPTAPARYAESSPLANPPQDSTCKAVLDASEKLFSTPSHLFTTIDMNGKPVIGETISVGGVIYVMVNGKWSSGMFTL